MFKIRCDNIKKNRLVLSRTRQYITENINHLELSLEKAAQHTHMTGRSLQRSLRSCNTSFIDIRDEIKSDLSIRYLKDPALTMEAISALVGFSDASGFYTAFKRWHDISPSDFRKII